MRTLTDKELKEVSGGVTNSNTKTVVVSAVNKSVIVKSVVVQQNGTTVKDYTKVIRR